MFFQDGLGSGHARHRRGGIQREEIMVPGEAPGQFVRASGLDGTAAVAGVFSHTGGQDLVIRHLDIVGLITENPDPVRARHPVDAFITGFARSDQRTAVLGPCLGAIVKTRRDAEGNSLSRPHLEGRLRGAGDHHCGSEQHASCQFQSNAHNCIIFIYRSISPGTAGLSP